MTQTVLGHKPGVGHVLKCLKYDTDNAMTLANNAYDRYYYNSESGALSYVFTTTAFYDRNAEWDARGEGAFDIAGPNGTVIISGHVFKYSSYWDGAAVYRISNAYPGLSYPPLTEFRKVNLLTNRVQAGFFKRDEFHPNSGSKTIVTSQQFYTVMGKCVGYANDTTTQSAPYTYTGSVWYRLNRVALGEWFVPVDIGTYGGTEEAIYPNIWELPADNTPMPAYSYQEGLLGLDISPTRFVLARPGYDVNSTATGAHIINSTRAPALCIMAGTINNLAPSGSVTLTAPPGIALSPRAVLDVMFRVSGQVWTVPSLMTDTSGYGSWTIEYVVSGNTITIYNSNKDTIDLRYVVFNADDAGTSSGGKDVIFRGNDGQRDFIQFKKPGTSDPASKPNDILFDSRFPQSQIVAEGYIPISSFGNNSGPAWKGARTYRLNFGNNGFIPYLKFSIVFPNCVTTPYHVREYAGSGFSGVSNNSMMGELFDTYVDFFASPDSGWTYCWNDSGDWKRDDWGMRIQGVRYYIFGIPPTD